MPTNPLVQNLVPLQEMQNAFENLGVDVLIRALKMGWVRGRKNQPKTLNIHHSLVNKVLSCCYDVPFS